MTKIVVPALESDDEMERHLHSLVDSSGGSFRKALDLNVSHAGAPARFEDVQITSVRTENASIVVGYEIAFTIHEGSEDLDVEREDRLIRGVRVEAGWEFQEIVQPPPRKNLDEL